MIIGNLNQLEQSKLEFSPAIYNALVRISQFDFSHLSDCEIKEDTTIYKIFHAQTSPSISRSAETHIDYIDIQFVISGSECLETYPLLSNKITTSCSDKDNYFYDETNIQGQKQQILLAENDFAVLFPWDIHKPLCQITETISVRKLVAKVPMSLLTDLTKDLQ